MTPAGVTSAHHRSLAGGGSGGPKVSVPHGDAAKRVKEEPSGSSGWSG